MEKNKAHFHFMQLAMAEAEKAAGCDEVPVGAVLVEAASGLVLSAAHNLTESDSDPTAHAELLAIRHACSVRQAPRLPDCDLYVTLEPCAMCAAAISFARIRRLYFAAYDKKGGGVEHGSRFFSQSTCHHKPEVYGGIEAETSSTLLKKFFAGKR